MGLGRCAVLGSVDVTKKPALYALLIVDAALAIGLALEVAAFGGQGANPVTQAVGLVVAPVASAALALAASKLENKKMLAIAMCALLVIGVAIARYAFYATCAM